MEGLVAILEVSHFSLIAPLHTASNYRANIRRCHAKLSWGAGQEGQREKRIKEGQGEQRR
jgi:hypothetical protein